MARPKGRGDDKKTRMARAGEWKDFRRVHIFTQRRLAGVLGLSRRTVQKIEAGTVTPHEDTRRRFAALQKKHDDHREV